MEYWLLLWAFSRESYPFFGLFFPLFASNPTLQQPSTRALWGEPAPCSNSAHTSPCCPALSPALTEPCSSMPTRRRMHSHLRTSRPCCPWVAQAHMFQPRSLGSLCGQSWDWWHVTGESYASETWLRDFPRTRWEQAASQNMVGLLWVMLLCSDAECPLIFLVELNCHHRDAGEIKRTNKRRWMSQSELRPGLQKNVGWIYTTPSTSTAPSRCLTPAFIALEGKKFSERRKCCWEFTSDPTRG